MSYKKVCKWFDVCPLKRFYERGKLDKKWIDEYCRRDNSECVRKKLEEDGVYHPDNMLPDGTIDEGLR
ncbi:MAG: uracil-DNA glycosylase [Candidatus Omnitrophota bacterium]|nr:uracil-DNA glycosylase [Candidatus Omnitrophota bacterium]